MNIKAWFKSKTADKVLSPIREAIIGLVSDGDKLLDVGCGTGDLLFRASQKIGFGLGVDLETDMIKFANAKKQRTKINNLEFSSEDIKSHKQLADYNFDIATSTLCLHEMTTNDAINTLKLLADTAPRIIIADYTTPRSLLSKASIEFDEFISGHYSRFRAYRRYGYLPYLAEQAGATIENTRATTIDGISIWELTRPTDN
jgi:SAM-dependent methyltransferase